MLLDDPGKDEIVYLLFDSVNLFCDVWVNESPIMIDHIGLFPFKMEITEEMSSGTSRGREAVITLKVTNTVTDAPFFFYNGFQYAYCNVPYAEESQNKDWFDEAWSGIADSAAVLILNKNHLEDIFIFTETIVRDEAFLKCRIKIRNNTRERFK